MKFEMEVNGQSQQVDVDPETPLLWVLRDGLGLTGTKFSCGIAQCGACTVFVDGYPVRSCVVPVRSLGQRSVVTIEGVEDRVTAAVQKAWEDIQVPQCGYCQSGQIMTAIALLRRTPNPDDEQIDAAMNGNVCRCATYRRIRGAIHRAAAELGGRS